MLCSIEIILWISISNVEKDIFVSDVKSFGNFKIFMNWRPLYCNVQYRVIYYRNKKLHSDFSGQQLVNIAKEGSKRLERTIQKRRAGAMCVDSAAPR